VTNGASLLRQTAIGAGWLVAWRIVTRFLGLASTLVLARMLMPADFGLLAMATSFAFAVEALSQFGLQDALVRHPEGDRLRDTGFTLQLARGLVTALMLMLMAPAAAWWFAEPRLVAVLLVLAVCALMAGGENIGIVAFRRDMRFDRQFTLLSVPRLLQVAVAIPLALALHSYWALLAGIVVGRLARTAMTYTVHPYRPRLSLLGWRELAGFSLWTWAGALAGIVWDRCDPFVLGPRIGAGTLGLYVQALELASLPATELIIPAVDALFAGFAAAQRQEGGRSSVHHAPVVALALLMGLLPLIITISCGAGDIVAVLLGPNWVAARGLVAILAWQSVFAPFAYVIGVTLVANGLVRRNFVANAITSALKLTVLVTAVSLTTRLDVVAAVTVGCVAAEAVVFLLVLPRGGTRDTPWRLVMLVGGVVRAMLAAGVAVAVLVALGLAWRQEALAGGRAFAHGLLIGAVTLLVYGAALLVAWAVAGRPDGPEQQCLELARRRFGHRKSKSHGKAKA
jgi:O-antigen/teichoic acid export membrane protein